MSDKLVFINTYRADPLKNMINDETAHNVFAFSLEAIIGLKNAKVPFSYVDDLFHLNVHQKLDTLAQQLAATWPEAFGDAMIYKGVPLGLCARTYFTNYFLDGLKCFAIASHAVRKYKPKKVLCSPPLKYGLWSAGNTMPMYSHLPYALEAVCKKYGIEFETLPVQENDQQFEKVRETRPVFDLAVKGRNLLRGMSQRLKHMAGPGKKSIFTIHLRPSLFERLRPIASEFGLELIIYDQASDNFDLHGHGIHDAFISGMSNKYSGLKAEGKLLDDIPKEFLPLKESMDIDFRHFIENTAPEMMCEVDHFDRVIDAYKINGLLCINDLSPLDKVRVSVARSKDVISCVLQHGVMGTRFWMNSFGPPFGDYNFIWGEGVKDIFIKGGFPADKIFATGMGQVDVIYTKARSKDEIERVKHELGIPEGKRIVLWATMPAHMNFTGKSLRVFEDEVLGVYETMKARQDKEVLVIKPHPTEPLNYYNGFAEMIGYRPVIATKYLPELLDTCDVLMANDSTVGIQALVMGKPYINLNTQVLKDLCGFVEMGVALPLDDIKDLGRTLDLVLHGDGKGLPNKEAIARYLENYASGVDGSGLRRIVERTAELVGLTLPS